MFAKETMQNLTSEKRKKYYLVTKDMPKPVPIVATIADLKPFGVMKVKAVVPFTEDTVEVSDAKPAQEEATSTPYPDFSQPTADQQQTIKERLATQEYLLKSNFGAMTAVMKRQLKEKDT